MPRIPRATIRQLAMIDHDLHAALLALNCGQAVGLAQYVRHPHGSGADLAVLVADGWQRHGIGRQLVTRLAGLGASRGSASSRPTYDPRTTRRSARWPLYGRSPVPSWPARAIGTSCRWPLLALGDSHDRIGKNVQRRCSKAAT